MKVIKGIILTVFLTVCLTSCFTGFFPETDEEIIGVQRAHSTHVIFRNNFNNTNNHPVYIYFTSDKSDTPTIVGARSQSGEVPIEPRPHFVFHFTYLLKMGDIEIHYDLPGRYGLGQTIAEVRRNQLTTVFIPSIHDKIIESGTGDDVLRRLTSDTYFSIRNNTPSAIYFIISGTSQQLHNRPASNVLNGGETGIYRISPQQWQNINNTNTGIRTATFQEFPLGISFDIQDGNGHLYNLVYTGGGSITLVDSTPINIETTRSTP
jgi:hypothetical protein